MIDEYASEARERPVCGNLGDTVQRPVLADLRRSPESGCPVR
jgi:hypothetical protein